MCPGPPLASDIADFIQEVSSDRQPDRQPDRLCGELSFCHDKQWRPCALFEGPQYIAGYFFRVTVRYRLFAELVHPRAGMPHQVDDVIYRFDAVLVKVFFVERIGGVYNIAPIHMAVGAIFFKQGLSGHALCGYPGGRKQKQRYGKKNKKKRLQELQSSSFFLLSFLIFLRFLGSF